jgi:hypothetical protein
MGANTITFVTNADIALNGAVTGTTTFTITPNAIGTSIGLGNAQAGTINLDATEIARITNGWSSLVFGRSDGTGAINVGALTFNDVVTLQNANAAMNVNGTLTMGGNNQTLRTNSDLAINGNLTGTGTLSIFQGNTNVSMGLGTGQAGTLYLDSTELGRITNGWANLIFGRTDSTAALNVGAASWNDNVTLRTGSGALNINGAQNLAGNSLTISTDADLAINAALTGTGTLTIVPSNNATSMGLGGAAGLFPAACAAARPGPPERAVSRGPGAAVCRGAGAGGPASRDARTAARISRASSPADFWTTSAGGTPASSMREWSRARRWAMSVSSAMLACPPPIPSA